MLPPLRVTASRRAGLWTSAALAQGAGPHGVLRANQRRAWGPHDLTLSVKELTQLSSSASGSRPGHRLIPPARASGVNGQSAHNGRWRGPAA